MPHGKRKDQGLHSLCVPVVELTLLQTPHLWSAEIAGATASLRWQRLALLSLYSALGPKKAKNIEYLSTGDSLTPLIQCSPQLLGQPPQIPDGMKAVL